MQIEQLITKAHLAVQKTFKEKLPPQFSFHNLSHTNLVVAASREIGIEMRLSKIELQTVVLACIFHDVGYTQTYEGHEALSASYAADFLKSNKISSSIIEDVQECIMSTKFPQRPCGILQEVICDADLYHLSVVNYEVFSRDLKLEREKILGEIQTDQMWDRANLEFLYHHSYFTPYGKNVLQARKMENVELLALRLKVHTPFKSCK